MARSRVKPLEQLIGSNPLPTGVLTGNPVPRPNEAAEPPVHLPTVSDAYDKKAGEFSGGASVGLPTLAFPNTEGAEADAGGGLSGPHQLLKHENMRRVYASDAADPESGTAAAANTKLA